MYTNFAFACKIHAVTKTCFVLKTFVSFPLIALPAISETGSHISTFVLYLLYLNKLDCKEYYEHKK